MAAPLDFSQNPYFTAGYYVPAPQLDPTKPANPARDRAMAGVARAQAVTGGGGGMTPAVEAPPQQLPQNPARDRAMAGVAQAQAAAGGDGKAGLVPGLPQPGAEGLPPNPAWDTFAAQYQGQGFRRPFTQGRRSNERPQNQPDFSQFRDLIGSITRRQPSSRSETFATNSRRGNPRTMSPGNGSAI